MVVGQTLHRLWANRRGSVGTIFLLMLPVVIGASGLAIDYGSVLQVRTQNQRIADAAAYSAAVTYNATGNHVSKYKTAAAKLVAINGLSGATVTTTIIPSPSDQTRNAAQVTISQNVPLWLSRQLAGKSSQTVTVSAAAELISVTANCIIALDRTSTGVGISGGSNVRANTCGVASNAAVTLGNCSNYIQSSGVTYDTTITTSGSCGGLPQLRKSDNSALTPVKKPVVDPYAGNTGVATATARLTTVNNLSSPSSPTVTIGSGGFPVTFDYTNGAIAQATANGCTASFASNTWTYNCPAGSNKTISAMSIAGGIKVRFNMTGNATNVLTFNTSITAADTITFGQGTYNIKGNYTGGYGGTIFQGIALNVTGSVDVGSSGAATFTSGTYNIARGLYLNGSASTTFGNGTFNIGTGVVACGGSYFSICALSSGGTTFGGPSTFTLAGGIRIGGGATVTMGSGSNNSYVIGSTAGGNAIRADGGAKLVMANATAVGNLYQIVGNILTDGGTCLIFGDASQHDIKGNLWSAGALKLGGGVYTVTGSVNLGYAGGGNVTCGGASVGLAANNVTLVIGATGTLLTTGDCANTAFCVGAGYSTVIISAPGSGDTAGFAVIGPQAGNNTAGARFTSGASGTAVNGVFYVPNGAIRLDGGAVLGNSVGGCLEVVGKSVAASQGGLIGSNCVSSGGASTFRVRLVA